MRLKRARTVLCLAAGCGTVGVAGCGGQAAGSSATFDAIGAPRTLTLPARPTGPRTPRSSSAALVIGTLTLRGGPGDRGIEMNNEIGWKPNVADEQVNFCIVGGLRGRQLLNQQRKDPDHVFPPPSLSGKDVAHECVYDTDSNVVPAGTYTVLVRVDAPSRPTTTSIYASGILWGPNGHNSGHMVSASIRRADHRDLLTVRVTNRD